MLFGENQSDYMPISLYYDFKPVKKYICNILYTYWLLLAVIDR